MHTSAWVALQHLHCNPLICCGNGLPSARPPFQLRARVCRPCVPAVLDGAALRIDDRLRVAKERREEADKQQGKSATQELFGFETRWERLIGICSDF